MAAPGGQNVGETPAIMPILADKGAVVLKLGVADHA
jgi:hypothetical protein